MYGRAAGPPSSPAPAHGTLGPSEGKDHGKTNAFALGVTSPLFFSGPGLAGEGMLVNLSMGGCWARITKTTKSLKPGMHVQVCPWLPDDPLPLTVRLAEVRCLLGREAAIEFIYMEPKEKERLERFLEGTRGDPEGAAGG